MIIQFSVENYRTFRNKATLSFVATNYDKDTREDENVIVDSNLNYRLLKSAVIYGANASGKSKFLEALIFMKSFILKSSIDGQKGNKIPVEPFRLNTESADEPSELEIVFVYKNEIYRYGFEVNHEEVVAEWLYHRPKTKEIEIFYRNYQTFETHKRKFQKGRTLIKEDLIRNNALLISVGAQFNEMYSSNVIDYFLKIGTISGIKEEGYEGYTIRKSKDPIFKGKILELLKAADLGIQDVQVETVDLEDLPDDMPKELRDYIVKKSKDEGAEIVFDISTVHKLYDYQQRLVGNTNLSMDEDESSGTKKFFALTGPILDTLENGYVLIIDELDSRLHPNLVCKIVNLFNSKENNPNNAQLLFNTHDTNLLGANLFRRDQIWFTEKNGFGEAKLFSLSDFKSEEVRKNESFEENYIRGKYGGVPYLGFFDEITHKN